MEVSGDELAGIVDMFGGVTRAELGDALVELAFKRGEERTASDFTDQIDDAIDAYQLVELDSEAVAGVEGEHAVVAGPAAFPTLPAEAPDLRHILDVPEREVDRELAGEQTAERLHEEAVVALRSDDEEAVGRLLDLSYDIELWAPIELAETRRLLEDGS